MMTAFKETVTLRQVTGGTPDPLGGGLLVNTAIADTDLVAVVNEITRADLKIDNYGNLVQGQLRAGDLELLVQDSALDWNSLTTTGTSIVRNGLEFQLVLAWQKPRNRWVLGFKKKEATS